MSGWSYVVARLGGGLFAVGFLVALLGMLLTILPEVIQAQKRRARLGRAAMGVTILGVALMLAAIVTG